MILHLWTLILKQCHLLQVDKETEPTDNTAGFLWKLALPGFGSRYCNIHYLLPRFVLLFCTVSKIAYFCVINLGCPCPNCFQDKWEAMKWVRYHEYWRRPLPIVSRRKMLHTGHPLSHWWMMAGTLKSFPSWCRKMCVINFFVLKFSLAISRLYATCGPFFVTLFKLQQSDVVFCT